MIFYEDLTPPEKTEWSIQHVGAHPCYLLTRAFPEQEPGWEGLRGPSQGKAPPGLRAAPAVPLSAPPGQGTAKLWREPQRGKELETQQAVLLALK